jgi:hypothetical protein
MTRKDFIIVAQIIAMFGQTSEETKRRISEILSGTNPSFDRERFWNAVATNIANNR